MEFSVQFSSPDRTHIIQHIGGVGLDMLDILKELFPALEKIDLKQIRVDSECPIRRNVCDLALSEDEARAAGHFKGKSHIKVNVPEAFFTQFVDWNYEERYDTPDNFMKKFYKGKLKHVYLKQVVGYKKIFQAWHEAGFPMEWETEPKPKRLTHNSQRH